MKYKKVAFLKEALDEDIGREDLARYMLQGKRSTAKVIAKQAGVLAGIEYINYFDELLDVTITCFKNDGDTLELGEKIIEISGSSADILSCERTLLDILQHASGIATNAKPYVKLTKGKFKILDTRKTRPLLREFEKYASRCGGVTNHRMGLDDCLMLKDTHLALFESIKSAVKAARESIPFTTKIEVECETFDQAVEAMESSADIVMCDNMERSEIKKVVKYKNKHFPSILIEASGNVSLDTIDEYVKTGVDAISSGSIIHQATFLDFSMKMKG